MGCLAAHLRRVCTRIISTKLLLTQYSNIDAIIDGRKSFPSGHSSTVFVGMTFTALFLAGKTAALCFRVSPFPGSLFNSRLARLILVLLPLAFSTWVAVTRVEDYVCCSPVCLASQS